MNVIQIMVTIIIVTILVSVVLGVGSYVAYHLRRARRPREPVQPESGPRFFFRYRLDEGRYGQLEDSGGASSEEATDGGPSGEPGSGEPADSLKEEREGEPSARVSVPARDGRPRI